MTQTQTRASREACRRLGEPQPPPPGLRRTRSSGKRQSNTLLNYWKVKEPSPEVTVPEDDETDEAALLHWLHQKLAAIRTGGSLEHNAILFFYECKELIGQIIPVRLDECKGFYYIGSRA